MSFNFVTLRVQQVSIREFLWCGAVADAENKVVKNQSFRKLDISDFLNRGLIPCQESQAYRDPQKCVKYHTMTVVVAEIALTGLTGGSTILMIVTLHVLSNHNPSVTVSAPSIRGVQVGVGLKYAGCRIPCITPNKDPSFQRKAKCRPSHCSRTR